MSTGYSPRTLNDPRFAAEWHISDEQCVCSMPADVQCDSCDAYCCEQHSQQSNGAIQCDDCQTSAKKRVAA